MALSPSEFKKLHSKTTHNTQKQMTGKYENTEGVDMAKGADQQVLENGSTKNIQLENQPRSLFSKHHLFYIKTLSGANYPRTEEEIADNPDLFRNLTPSNLVANPQGALIYNPNDFLYVKDIDVVPLNRLITLNKFAYPCSDNIFDSEFHSEPPISTMLTLSTMEYNQLSEILSMQMGLRWRKLDSKIDQMSIQGDQSGITGGSKITRNLLSLASPEFGQNAIQGGNRLNYNPYHDENKTYGKVDSIDSTHIRDRGLDWEQPIKLTFKYEMRAYNGISQKAAFIDLLSNVFLMSTNDASFWGGARYWLGQRPSRMATNLKFMNPRDYRDFLNKGHASVKSWLGSLGGGNALDTLKQVASNVLNLALGKFLDKVGRPSIPFMNSLLTNDPVGNYHLTIGNPFNPIMMIGNLINDGVTSIKFGDTLGYEDFPTSVEIEISLKPALGRGRAGAEAMFNGGARTYWKPKDVYKGNSAGIPSSAQNPTLLGDFVSNGINGTNWGDFTKEGVLRNSQSVYKYVKRNVT